MEKEAVAPIDTTQTAINLIVTFIKTASSWWMPANESAQHRFFLRRRPEMAAVFSVL
jgi:hypothetical protein